MGRHVDRRVYMVDGVQNGSDARKARARADLRVVPVVKFCHSASRVKTKLIVIHDGVDLRPT